VLILRQNAPEKLELKTKLLAEIDEKTRKDVVITSSSSGLPSSKFIGQCKNPERVLIGHPFNPPHLMPLVEVVPHPSTSEAAITTAIEFYSSLGRKPVHIKQETPGFVANRLQAAVCNEAYSLVSRGIVSAEELDACMTSSLGPRWAMVGPFMANAMGGGGGSDGFRHLMEHLGPAMQSWTEDMREHAFDWKPDGIEKLTASVEDELAGKDVAALEQRRDRQLVELFKGQRERRAST
jgi:3-hydroxyacyl-CoA dehydrogenase